MRLLYRLLRNLIALALAPFWLGVRVLSRPKRPWLLARLSADIEPIGAPPPAMIARLVPFFQRPPKTSLERLRKLANTMGKDPRVVGLVLELPAVHAGWATCTGLRDIVLGLRKAGKQVVVYLPRGGGNKELYVASAADRLVLSPAARIGPLGVSAELRYLRPALERLGISVEVEARHEFKTAAEPALRDEPSPEQQEQVDALMTGIHEQLLAALAAREGCDAQAVLERCLFGASDAIELGVADAIAYDEQLAEVVLGDEAEAVDAARSKRRSPFGSAPSYLAWHEARLLRRLTRRPYVAVVRVHGMITVEAGQRLPGSRRQVAPLERLVADLRRAAAQRRVAGVVLHVDSPGGSALASDLIHREVVALGRKKPVVACFGNTAASGGYYVAAPASAIVAQPTTITGSIGVIMIKPLLRALLDRVGVRTFTMRKTDHADMLSAMRGYDDREREIIAAEADAMYDMFVAVVATGRQRPIDEVEPLARGRVWSGAAARERGLVDAHGGLDVALEEVKRRLTDLSDEARQRLELEVLPSSRGAALPAIPAPPAAGAAAWPWTALDQSVGDLVVLATDASEARALYYATGIPRIT